MEDKIEVKTPSKIDMAIEAVKAKKFRVVILTGTDSPEKKLFAKSMLAPLKEMNLSTATVSNHELFDIKSPQVYALTLDGVDRANRGEADKISSLVRQQVERGWLAVIITTSMTLLEEKMGKDFVDYVSHVSVEVDLSKPRGVIPVI